MTFFKDGSKWTEEIKLLKCNTLKKTKIRIRSYKRKPITNHYPTLYFFSFLFHLTCCACNTKLTFVSHTKKGLAGFVTPVTDDGKKVAS